MRPRVRVNAHGDAGGHFGACRDRAKCFPVFRQGVVAVQVAQAQESPFAIGFYRPGSGIFVLYIVHQITEWVGKAELLGFIRQIPQKLSVGGQARSFLKCRRIAAHVHPLPGPYPRPGRELVGDA